MESDDEDVIFENSVLHQVLEEIGVTNLKTEPRLHMEDNAESGADVHNETNRLSIGTEAKRLCNFNSDFMTSIFYSSKVLQEVHHYHRYHLLKWLISSQLLSEDDQLFLQSYVDEEAPIRDPLKSLSSYTSNFFCLLIVSLILVNIVSPVDMLSSWVVLLTDSLPEAFSGFTLYSGIISTLLLNLIWILCVAVLFLMMRRRICQKVLSKMQKQDNCIQDLVREAVELLRLEKKCLRLIKESELVARGFTLASQHHVTYRGSSGQSSTSSNQLCQGLRQVMLTENIRVMQEIKKRVIKMMRGIPMICMDSDFSTLEDLKVYDCSPNNDVDTTSDTLGIRSADTALSGQTTDSAVDGKSEMDVYNRCLIISPSELNRSAELLSVYFSGFIRRLALCFFPQNLRDKTINPYEATRECTEMSRKAVERARTLIIQSYTFYRAIHQYDGNGAPKKVQGLKHSGQSQIYNLYVCVNSLDLHLQSLLQITRGLTMSLEDRIDKEQCGMISVDNEDNAETNTISKNERELWEDILKRIKSSLESCRGCYEESLKHLHQRTDKDTRTTSALKETSHDMDQPKQTKVTWIPAEDPIIVDQVFEAISDTVEEEEFPESRPRYNAEDRAKHQEEKEAIRRFRQELQTVVSHRAIDQKAREERALARARGEVSENQDTHLELSTGQHLIEAAEMVPGITHIKSAELEEKPFSSIQIEEEEYKVASCAAENSHTSVSGEEMLKCKSSWEQCCQIGWEENLSVISDHMSPSTAGEQELFVHKYDTCPASNTSFDTLEFHNKSFDNSEHHKSCTGCNNFPEINQAVTLLQKKSLDISEPCNTSLDISEPENKSIDISEPCNKSIDISEPENNNIDISEPHNKTYAGYVNSSETRNSARESGDYINTSYNKEENDNNPCSNYLDLKSIKEESEENSVASKDSRNDLSLPQNAAARLSNSFEQPHSTHDAVETEQNSSRSPTSNTRVMSQEKSITADGSRIELLKPKGLDLQKFHDENIFTVPSFPSSNLAKNLAMMAACQARTFTNSYLEEEQFGDDSSDSQNSDSDR